MWSESTLDRIEADLVSTIVFSGMPDIVVRPESNVDNHPFKGMVSYFEYNMEKNRHFDLEFIVSSYSWGNERCSLVEIIIPALIF